MSGCVNLAAGHGDFRIINFMARTEPRHDMHRIDAIMRAEPRQPKRQKDQVFARSHSPQARRMYVALCSFAQQSDKSVSRETSRRTKPLKRLGDGLLGFDADAVGLRRDRQNHVRGPGDKPRVIGLNVLWAVGRMIRRCREEIG
jgi:hypothetical protein